MILNLFNIKRCFLQQFMVTEASNGVILITTKKGSKKKFFLIHLSYKIKNVEL